MKGLAFGMLCGFLAVVALINWQTWFPVNRDQAQCSVWLHSENDGSTYLCLKFKGHSGGHEFLLEPPANGEMSGVLRLYDASQYGRSK